MPPEASKAAPLRAPDAAVRQATRHAPQHLHGLREAVRATSPSLLSLLFTAGANSSRWVDVREQAGASGGGVRAAADGGRGRRRRARGERGSSGLARSTGSARAGRAEDRPASRPARGRIEWGGKTSGIRESRQRHGEKLSLRDVPAAAELDVAPLVEGASVPQLGRCRRSPTPRDLSIDVAERSATSRSGLVREAGPRNNWSRPQSALPRTSVAKGQKSGTARSCSPEGTLTGDRWRPSVQKVSKRKQNSARRWG